MLTSSSMRIMMMTKTTTTTRRLPSLLWAAATTTTTMTAALLAFTTTCTYNTQAVTGFTTHESFTVPSSSSSSSNSIPLIGQYDAFILDQFGVMHNGKNSLDGAKELIDLMIAKNKKLIILSNTSSPSSTTLKRLGSNNLGFNSEHFLGAITSGEEAIKYINNIYGTSSSSESSDVNKKKKKKFIWFTWDLSLNENVPNPMDFIDQLGDNIEPTININEADFIVAHGVGVIRGNDNEKNNDDDNNNDNNNIISIGNFINDDKDWIKIDQILKECSIRKLPLICANPDLIVKYHDGTKKNMPGQIANRYKTKFNMKQEHEQTIIFGKPNKEHFQACIDKIYQNQKNEFEQLEQQKQHDNDNNNNKENEESLPRLRIAHVGDSISHDIAGANSVDGIDSIFIIGGIHSDELRVESVENDDNDNDNDKNDDNNVQQKLPSDKQLNEFFDNKGHTPTHVVPMFRI
jgi:ribonucleotide monophosphatase NagD (HAD superfamily)